MPKLVERVIAEAVGPNLFRLHIYGAALNAPSAPLRLYLGGQDLGVPAFVSGGQVSTSNFANLPPGCYRLMMDYPATADDTQVHVPWALDQVPGPRLRAFGKFKVNGHDTNGGREHLRSFVISLPALPAPVPSPDQWNIQVTPIDEQATTAGSSSWGHRMVFSVKVGSVSMSELRGWVQRADKGYFGDGWSPATDIQLHWSISW